MPESSLAPERKPKAKDILRSLSVVMLLIPTYLQTLKADHGIRGSQQHTHGVIQALYSENEIYRIQF